MQRYRWGFNFQVVPTTLSGTRCLPMVPSLVGEGTGGGSRGRGQGEGAGGGGRGRGQGEGAGGGGRSAWVIAVGKAPTSQKLPLLENGQIRAYLVEHRDLHQ
jgi:hypothetical protein